MAVDPQTIHAEPHVHIGRVIRADAAVLLQKWSARACEEQPHAKRVHFAALLDHLGDLLRAIGTRLEAEDADSHEHDPVAGAHGAQRWQAGWSLREVVRDYQMLRIVIHEHLEEALDRSLRYREIMAINLILDEAITASVDSFVASQNERQRTQNRALEEADRRKDTFLAVLGHELRNPLFAVVNGLNLMRQLGITDARLDNLGQLLERQVAQMTRLVDDLLDVSRIRTGKLELRKRRIRLREVVEGAVATITAPLQTRNHHLQLNLPAADQWLDCDPGRLQQVLSNLLLNAVKYTPQGGQIVFTAEITDSEAVFMVEDNGRGIAAAMLPRVFELFMQSSAAAESHPEGLGVGLMLVERLVKLHGGSVAATSPGPGKGSTFTVRLPVRSNHQLEPQKPAVNHSSVEHKTMRILLVEDNEDVAQILKTLLQRWGHVVRHANTGKEALSVVGEHAADVVLLDIGLPDMSGYQVAGKLREQTETSGLKLVAMTGYRDDGEPNHEGLFDQRLLKPVDFRVLEQLLQTMAPQE